MNNDLTPREPSSKATPAKPTKSNAMNHTDFDQTDSTQFNAEPTNSNCPAFADDLLAYRHRELPMLRCALVGWHLSRCPNCRKELDAMNQIAATLKESEAPEASRTDESPALVGDKLNPELRAKILAHLPERAADTPLPTDAAPTRSTFSHRSPCLAWGMAGATACILAAVLFPTFSRSRENARRASRQADYLSRSAPAETPSRGFEPGLEPPASMPPSSPAASAGATVNSLPPSAGAVPSWRNEVATEQQQANIVESMDGSARRAAGTAGSSTPLSQEGADMVLTPYRRVHKQGSLTVEVSGLEAGSNAVETMIQKAGGFVAKNDLSTGSDGLQSASMEIRVPVKQFDAVIKEISALGKVRDKRITGEDITARVSDADQENNVLAADLRARLAQYQKAKERAALGKRAVADDWRYRTDIRQMRIQLAQVRARLDLLKKMSDFASLSVQLREKSPAPNSGGLVDDISNTGKAAFDSLLLAARLPITLFIYILVFSPFWVPILMAWRYFLRTNPRRTGGI